MTALYFLLRVNRSSWSRGAELEYDYADDYVAEDYPTLVSSPTDSEYLLGIAM
jgi:hypothetical protein